MGLELIQLLPDDQLVPLPATRTDADDDEGYATPTSAAAAAAAVCPPAPRKPRPPRAGAAKRTKRRHWCSRQCSGAAAQPRWIVAVPHDLAAVFVARRPPAAAVKKTPAHAVG